MLIIINDQTIYICTSLFIINIFGKHYICFDYNLNFKILILTDRLYYIFFFKKYMPRKLFELFSNFIFKYAAFVCFVTFILTFVIPFVILFVFPLGLGNNPEKGFETDGTPYSKPRLTWTRLQPYLLQGSQVEFINEIETIQRFKRSWANDLVNSMFSVVNCYDEPIPAMSFLSQFVVEIDSIDNLFSIKLIQQLCSLKEKLFFELSEFSTYSLYKNIWNWPSFVNCLTPNQRNNNCSEINEEEINNFYSLFIQCLQYKQTILYCGNICGQSKSNIIGSIKINNNRYRRQFNFNENIIKEEKEEEDFEYKNKCFEEINICKKFQKNLIPFVIANKKIKISRERRTLRFDLFYRILPEDVYSKPLLLNNFLPFYTFSAYRLQGINIPLKLFINFESKIKKIAQEKSSIFKLKGLSLDTKRDLLLEAALRDSTITLFCALIVFLLLAIYSLSLTFAFIVSLQLGSAVLSSLALFRLFISSEMPALNLISFVLLISVGSDGAFLLLDVFPTPERLTPITLNKSLMHTAKTMFLTQFSTVIPFLLNLLSSVYAFRSFGLFAGLTLIFNYFLLITFLPAFLVLQSRFLNPWLIRWWPSRCWYCFPNGEYSNNNSPRFSTKNQLSTNISRCSPPIFKFPLTWLDRLRQFIRLVLDDLLPSVLIQGRFIWLCSLFLFLLINIYIIITQLSLPRYNPLQLFRTSNLHEFYDQNAEQFFPFIVDKIGELPFSIRLVWGIQFVNGDTSLSNYFDLDVGNHLKQQKILKEDFKNFKLNSTIQLKSLASQISRLQQLNFVNLPIGDKFWPERFIEWTSSFACNTTFPNFSPCCRLFGNRIAPITSSIFDHCVRLSTTILPTGYNDTLIWDKETHKLVGYTALLPTKIVYSHRFSNLSASFALLDQTIKPIINNGNLLNGWYTTEWGVISQWFDLQRSIINDCEQSFIISFLVVLLFSTIMLRLNAIFATITIVCIVICTLGMLLLFGWEIGVLEAVILVVVVGLSFDYTLHFGATMNSSKVCPSHSIQLAIRCAFRPVVMSAISSILAGAVMLFAETHAFFQKKNVGIFLVVCSFLSLLFAIFFFLPFFYIITTFTSKIYYYFLFLAINEKSDKKNSKRKENNCEWCKISQKHNTNLKMKKINKNKDGTNNHVRIKDVKDNSNEFGTKISGIQPNNIENSIVINTNNILQTPNNHFFSSAVSSFVGRLKFDPRDEEYEYGDIIKL
ncbi:hypothetical protein Mgra_00001432 [Meloidogyne graminicola]|uniref:SSD domain-containing protein n=1 Tax=Meloidogyne graminicola TaxID=189291 RepID=A0A8S9ZZR2_9BILA|nr:hypothetical protein Mgra_00001432 [Meloidogyne graminicola]